MNVGYKKRVPLVGYHGTLSCNVESILANNFFESTQEIWLGKGVYFFVEGIAAEGLEHWALQHTFDNCKEKYKPSKKFEISVLSASINVKPDLLLDLTDDKFKRMFNSFRKDAIKRMEVEGRYIKHQLSDSSLLAVFKELMGFEFIKKDVYIRLGYLRSNGAASRIENVTIFVVNNPTNHILKPSIKEVYKGEVS